MALLLLGAKLLSALPKLGILATWSPFAKERPLSAGVVYALKIRLHMPSLPVENVGFLSVVGAEELLCCSGMLTLLLEALL